MSILEILGVTWIILIISHFFIGFFGLKQNIEETRKQEDAAIQEAITAIVNSNTQVAIEIIKFEDATIYYAYQNLTRKFLTQGRSEQEVLDNLSKKHGKVQFQIVSREYVETTY